MGTQFIQKVSTLDVADSNKWLGYKQQEATEKGVRHHISHRMAERVRL